MCRKCSNIAALPNPPEISRGGKKYIQTRRIFLKFTFFIDARRVNLKLCSVNK